MKIWKVETNKRMIPLKRKNNIFQSYPGSLRNEPYLVVNIIFTGVILLIIGYSGIFSPEENNYPVACLHEELTGFPCVSCGLSHSFSLIVRGRINESYNWNPYGMRVFIFFASQLLLRMVFSFFYIRHKATRRELIIIDCIGSGIIFLIAFWPFIENIAIGILSPAI